jgi:hypothetical protein
VTVVPTVAGSGVSDTETVRPALEFVAELAYAGKLAVRTRRLMAVRVTDQRTENLSNIQTLPCT